MIKNINRKKSAIAVALACSVMATFSYAEDSIKLDKVEVTGILPEKLESVPGSFNVIDEKELEARRPFSVQEALSNVAGVHVVGEDSFGLGLNIGIRGMDPRRTSRTLLLEDGMPLFLAPYGDPSAHYSTPLDRVSRIEVVKGSGQVLYGPQTVGGMINFVTKPVPKDGFAGSVSAVGGNNDFYGLHANVGYGNERGGIMVDAIKKEGDGIRKNHDFDVEEYTLKGQLNLTDRQTLIAKVGYYKEDSNVSETGLGEVDYANDKFQAPSGKNDFFTHERKSAQLQHIFQIDDKMKLSTQAYYANSYRSSFRQTDAPGGYDDANNATGITVLERCDTPGVPFTEAQANACGGRHRPRSYNYWGIEPRLDVSHNLFGIESDAVIGFRYHEEDIKRQQFRGDTADYQSLSFAKANSLAREDIGIKVEAKSYYAQNTFHVNDWAITPGVRVEDIQIKTDIRRAGDAVQNNPESNLTNNQTEVLPGFGVAWNGIANTTFFGGVHKGFAPPRPDRDIRVKGANTAVVDKTKPETSTNWEIGVRSNYFKGVNFSSTLFHTQFDDIVVNNGAGEFVNGGESAMSGLEFGGRVDFGTIYNTAHNIYVLGSYTNTFTAKFKKDGEDAGSGIVNGDRLPYAPRHLASISLGYQHPVGLDARIGATYISKQEVDAFARALDPVDAALSGLAGDVPSYTLFNASVNFKPVGSKVTYFASGYNLTDREYLQSRVDGMSVGRGRQVFGGIRYDF
ncbi:MAG: TonB-dependent receptor [Methylotenera sp.]|nr:TonB-dependent receptor [Methylotenera sp.]MDP1754168.1 TonB-dependent receptor [Methylotenera sp.]MDP1959746.1 TonB-dependent receptor [Methylotenera sp.]MDP3943315.1 TonB-dependent receptor [Methylotenera sp.]